MEKPPTQEQIQEIWEELVSCLREWQKQTGASDSFVSQMLENIADGYRS